MTKVYKYVFAAVCAFAVLAGVEWHPEFFAVAVWSAFGALDVMARDLCADLVSIFDAWQKERR